MRAELGPFAPLSPLSLASLALLLSHASAFTPLAPVARLLNTPSLQNASPRLAPPLAGRLGSSGGRTLAPAGAGLLRIGAPPLSAALVAHPEGESDKRLPAYSRLTTFQVKGKEVNPVMFLLFLLGAFGWAILLFPFLSLAYMWSMVFDPYRRRAVDMMVRIWAMGATLLMLYYPKLIGAQNLPDPNEGVMYIPNHSSYLDIFTLSGAIPRRFKYVSKQEVLDVPIIGWAMKMAGHIGIKRMDKRSQLQTFKETVEALKYGNSVVTFAEGTRSEDGRLKKFKKGPIKMAQKAGVKIVPVSICNMYKWMPSTSATPLAVPQNIEVKIHPAIDPQGKEEDEVLEYVFNAVNSGLPEFQKCEIPEPVPGK